MSRPWLSVIMPTYNGASFLTNALNSILSQADDQIEVIAVDDGSTDATIPILKSFATKLSLRIVTRETYRQLGGQHEPWVISCPR